jgi:single-stranded-DNA-specific exonuclease
MPADRIPEFRDRINAHGLACLEPTDLMPRLRIDSELRLAGIDSRVVSGLEQMAPFGLANAKPVFDATGVELLGTPRRIKDRHLKVQVRQDGRVFQAIAWRSAEKAAQWEQHRQSLRLAYSLDKQTFRGETTIELTVADLRCPDQATSPGTA